MNKVLAEDADAPAVAAPATSRISPQKVGIIAAAAIVLVAGALLAIRHWQFYSSHEETDDAQVEGDISPVLPRVSGYVDKVLVVENQSVTAGQSLMQVDSQELDLKVKQAEA